MHFAYKKRHFLYALHYWEDICIAALCIKREGFCACTMYKMSIFCEHAHCALYGLTMQAVCLKKDFVGSPQRHTLRDG